MKTYKKYSLQLGGNISKKDFDNVKNEVLEFLRLIAPADERELPVPLLVRIVSSRINNVEV